MSFDLYFTAKDVSNQQLSAYFGDRANYEVSDQQAIYQNQDTGVYFIFDFADEEDDDNENIATFILNLFRPHFFGIEAVKELTAFVDHFGCLVFDPQSAEEGYVPYSAEEILGSWNRSNEFGYASIANQKPPTKTLSLPTEKLEAIWNWNYFRKQIQESIQEDIFIPKIFLAAIKGNVVSGVVWLDAIPQVIPKVDYLLIMRDRLAKTSILGLKKKEKFLIPFDQAELILSPYKSSDYSLPCYKLPALTSPPEVEKFVQSLKKTEIVTEIVAMDNVLNTEILEKYVNR